MAVDRAAIQKVVMRGLSVPAAVVTAPGVHGYPRDLDKNLPRWTWKRPKSYWPKQLPNGFEVALDVPNDRTTTTRPSARQPWGCWQDRDQGETGGPIQIPPLSQGHEAELRFLHARLGVPTLDSAYVFSYLYQKDGQWNATGYDNPRVNQLAKEINVETNLPKRDALIAEVWKMVYDDMVYIPLHHQVIVWAMKKNLELPIDAQDAPQFRVRADPISRLNQPAFPGKGRRGEIFF